MYISLKELLRSSLRQEFETLPEYLLIIRVEFGLRLLENLGLQDQSVLTLWALMQGLETPAQRSLNWSVEHKHMIGNARALLREGGYMSWRADFLAYADITPLKCCYSLTSEPDLENQTVRQSGNATHRLHLYDLALANGLDIANHKVKLADPGRAYFKYSSFSRGEIPVQVNIPEDLVEMARSNPLPRLSAARERKAITVTYDTLSALAQEMDQLELAAGLPGQHWQTRVGNIRYRSIQVDGSLSPVNNQSIYIDQTTHIAGMVGAGKSTLMLLLAYQAARDSIQLGFVGQRLTLVVPDTMEALRLTEYFNSLLCAPDKPPVAVTLLGYTARGLHLERLVESRDFDIRKGHWGLRYLSTVCPLQALIPGTDLAEPIPIGREPCGHLKQGDQQTITNSADLSGSLRACPLFSLCPTHQVYKDMPGASIWITTPGAMGSAGVPYQADPRRVKLWTLIYENSDLVIFDEVDTVQLWFDQLHAPEILLDDGRRSGLLRDVNRLMAELPSNQSRVTRASQRWFQAQHTSVSAAQHMLYLEEKFDILKDWVGRNGYFTALKLLFNLAEGLVGIDRYVDPTNRQCQQRDEIVAWFNILLGEGAGARPGPATPQAKPVNDLLTIVNSIVAQGNSDISAVTSAQCREWIRTFIPEIPIRENRTHDDEETRFSQQLEISLAVVALDNRLRTMLEEWHNAPPSISDRIGDSGLQQRAPREMAGLLPVPAPGRLFGFHCIEKRIDTPNNSLTGMSPEAVTLSLSAFEYSAIGRHFAMNFHKLLSDIDGRPGPAVLALSGTSWLPASSKMHFDIAPRGVLESEPSVQKAIHSSHIEFWPQHETTKAGNTSAIGVSGEGQRMLPQLQKLTEHLAAKPTAAIAPLSVEMDELQRLGIEHPPQWADRDRILLLVNSYDQTSLVANTLKRTARLDLRDKILALVRNGDEAEGVQRGDVEHFVETGGKILIAPLNAVGRGYNILNQNGVAAFGSVFFLIRPMPQPHDTQALAVELNQRTLDWCRNENAPVWGLAKTGAQGILDQQRRLRRQASQYLAAAENRRGYRALVRAGEVKDLAASTAGTVIQACGRLLRGGVPFRAYFVDAKWGPNNAQTPSQPDTSETSLLVAVLALLAEYANTPIGQALYAPLHTALSGIRNFRTQP